MFNLVLSSAIALHAIIHLMGFVREWDLGPVGRFSKKIVQPPSGKSRFVGVLWLLGCILLLASAFTYYLETDWFGIVAVCGVVISQSLIFVYWTNVKWASIANVILLSLIFLAGGRLNFKYMAKEEVAHLMATTSNEEVKITNEKISALPYPVQRWLIKSHVVGKSIPKSIHVVQKGELRTNANGKWMPFDAEQYFAVDPPGFMWTATIHSNKFFDIVGRDKYQDGKGNMLIKVASLFTIANSKGKEIDQGSMVRFMAELIWFPQAAVSEYVKWEEIDKSRARITMRYKDKTANGIYTFNNDGLPVTFEAQRYGDFNGKFSKEIWSVATTSYGTFNGMPIPNASQVTWTLKDGDFDWLRIEVVNVVYQ